MHAFTYFEWSNFLDTIVSLFSAFVLGGVIGLERQFRQRTAGLRTNVLVAVGAALFVDIAMRYHALHGGSPSTLQVIAYVVSGVGFLGAGVIMREGGNVRGINTAATLWGSAAVGCAAGADLLPEAIMGALFVLAANTLLRPAVNHINRRPLHPEEVEVTYSIHVVAADDQAQNVVDALSDLLDAHQLPIQDTEMRAFGEDRTEIETCLLTSSLKGSELDTIIVQMRQVPGVEQVFWQSSTTA